MPSKTTARYNDYDREASAVTLQGLTLTAANFDAQITAYNDLLTAIGAITRGILITKMIGNETVLQNNRSEPATSEEAQRESKWLVRYHETTGGLQHTCELPCANRTFLDPNNRGFAEMGDGAEVDAFVTAFEAFVKSDAGLGVTVDSIEHVGRNS